MATKTTAEYLQQFQLHIAEDRSHVVFEFRINDNQLAFALKPEQAVGIARKILQDLASYTAGPGAGAPS